MKLILDVGSGINPLKREDVIHVDVNKLNVHLELVADAQNLPFRDNSFEIVYASHILEHLTNPFKALSEFKRVSKNFVVVKVPNASYEDCVYIMSLEHLFSWTETTFKQFLKKVFSQVKVSGVLRYKSEHRGFKHKLATIKFYIISLFWKTNELIGVCEK